MDMPCAYPEIRGCKKIQEEISSLQSRIISLKAACSIEEYDTADYIDHVHKANDKANGEVAQLKDQINAIRIAAQPFVSLSGIVKQMYMTKLENALKAADKIEADTGGGCSVCGQLPAINIDGAYWLCRDCISERLDMN